MNSHIQSKLFARAVQLQIQGNPGYTREEIRQALPPEMEGSVLNATITLLRHKLIRQEGGKPARFYPV
jgi:hypothetical protein